MDLFYEILDKQVIAYERSPQGTFGVQILPKDFRHRRPSVWQDPTPRSRGWESSTLTTRPSGPPQLSITLFSCKKWFLLIWLTSLHNVAIENPS